MKECKMPSGARLRINIAPFTDAKELYQAVAEELKLVEVNYDDDLDVNMLKNLACSFLSSKRVERALIPCMNRCLYNDKKVSDEVFEDVEARQDYIECITMITWENIHPFVKAHFARFQDIFSKVAMGQ